MNAPLDKPKTHDELELTIDNLAFGGKGVARRAGFVIFVEGAVPGDRVRAVVTHARRSYAEARVKELLNQSPERVEPKCRHFGVCGGCSWQTLSYDAQLRYKQSQVTECLEHIGGIHGFEIDEPLAAEPLWRYRNKVEFSFSPGDNLDLGFHLPGEWRRVVNIQDCLLHSETTNAIRNAVRDFARSTGLAAWEQQSETGFWRHLVLREGINTGEIMVNIVTGPGDFPDAESFAKNLMAAFPGIASLVWSVNDTRASVATGFPFTVLAGRDHIFEEICGLRFKVSPQTFLQTNTLMAERLYRKALEYAGLEGHEFVFDLYSGIGSIALLMAKSCSEILGIEIVEDAVRLARENALANGVTNSRFISGKVRAALKNIELDRQPDLVVLDPPRAGASKKEVQRVIELGAPRIVYVSCNASTLAGNAAQLAEGGYQLIRTGAVDMFPHTPHIEVVSLFERS
ncbi:MAG: 23S rRNA (uracil(1939)-C(5))-methyltransferase RlmD [Thermoleophilia bacterium]|nr:23S rRNA (uracil(1939)-C(5))-methyltransferase RlmD [Thermoleophilia bacterium]